METVAVGQPELKAHLVEDPTSFEFFQAVRVLERLLPGREPVGMFSHPSEEVARFTVNPDIAFPASEIQSLGLDGEHQARMMVNFMGMTGPEGVLPYCYSLLVAERIRERDTALRDFLDIFHHRIISLFYRSWEKYRFAVSYERDQQDRLTHHLKDLVGLGEPGLQNRLGIKDDALLFYTGLLGPQQRSAAALEQLISDYFGVTAAIEQFVGGWYPLADSTECTLGDEGDPSEQLGWGAVAGEEVWDPQARVRLRLGPLTRRQYDDFLPLGGAHGALRTLTRFFCGEQFDFEVQLVLAQDEVPPVILGGAGPGSPLGWCTWMRSQPFSRNADDTILTL
ncbi:MAG TPA: type VI secretion system baseplate subunit TssG [Gemmatimonadales bacterium]|jgi:type VI secretion system protein ImpH